MKNTKNIENIKKENAILKAEVERLNKEAHDKHWPLANACRNLLPHAETNIEQVKLAARMLSNSVPAIGDGNGGYHS